MRLSLVATSVLSILLPKYVLSWQGVPSFSKHLRWTYLGLSQTSPGLDLPVLVVKVLAAACDWDFLALHFNLSLRCQVLVCSCGWVAS